MKWECCWNREVIEAGECPNISAEDAYLLSSHQRRILERCCHCAHFSRDLETFRNTGHPLAPVISLIHGEFRKQNLQIQSLLSFLDNKSLEIRFFHELGSVLQSSVELDEVLSVALTAITAGKGFGMNRAFLLLVDRSGGVLKGYLAIGPRNYEEANRVWSKITEHDLDLQTLAQMFRKDKLVAERAKFTDILEKIAIPLADASHLLINTLQEQVPRLIEDAFHHPDVPQELARLLGVDTFLLMPLLSRDRWIGMIIADNCITHHRITEEAMRSLETFSFPVAFAIERASLYERLQVELSRVTEAGTKLKEQQELIVKMEKMALVGRITSSIAHSIRNPLMIIGGFARSMLKTTSSHDPKRGYIDSIVGETRQLEGILDEILRYSDSLYPVRDFWGLDQLMKAAFHESDPYLQDKNYHWCQELPPDLPKVYVDYKQLLYCLRAILQNDIDGIGIDHRITVSACQDRDSVVVCICDYGKRISQEELDLVLTPFSSAQELGASLGLALCRTVLDKHGIPMVVTAKAEGGIEFMITLPTRKEGEPNV